MAVNQQSLREIWKLEDITDHRSSLALSIKQVLRVWILRQALLSAFKIVVEILSHFETIAGKCYSWLENFLPFQRAITLKRGLHITYSSWDTRREVAEINRLTINTAIRI